MKARSLLLTLILLLGVLYLVVPVYAQTVTVSNLQYSSTSVLGKQVTVSFTVNYGGASAGDYLIISVWDVKANNYASGSTINSYPDSCPQITGTYSWAAGCAYALSNLQAAPDYATETVSFALAMNSVGTYQFSPLAAIEDTSFNVLSSSSLTQNEFSISVLDKFALTVSLPSQVPLTLDGVQQGAGSTNLQLSPGAHVMSVPDIVQLDSTSRLKFNGWSDGSNQTMRTFDLESDMEIVATYVTQYFVTSTTDSTLQSGWYDEGTVLQFTVDNTQLVNSYRLLVDGFDGWYNSGQLITKSPTASLTIDGPVNLSDHWNYMPYLPPLLFVVIVAVILFFARRGTIPIPQLPELKMLSRKRSRKRTRSSNQKVEAITPEPERQVVQTAKIRKTESSKQTKTAMYCKECGAKIPRDSIFCEECGSTLVKE